eukprot:SAG22_NODE_660_length_8069_cov_7.799951_5_plen_670_part_00
MCRLADVEIVPDRYTFADETAVSGWGTVPAPCCVAQASGTASGVLLLMTSGNLLMAAGPGGTSSRKFTAVPVKGDRIGPNSTLILGEDGMPRAVATPAGVLGLECSVAAAAASLSCTVHSGRATAALGPVHATAFVPGAAAFPDTIAGAGPAPALAFVASANGLFRVVLGPTIEVSQVIDQVTAAGSPAAPNPAMTAVVAGPDGSIICGNAVKVWILDARSGKVRSWSWVTAPSVGAGGVYDDAVRSMALDRTGNLYVGNNIALNVRTAVDGSVSRVAGEQGLPYANITAIVTTVSEPAAPHHEQLWLGTEMGVAVRSSDPAADPEWRYLFGPRWHPGKSVTALAEDKTSAHTVFAATDGGVVFLEQQLWTLAKKAELMQSALARHDRHGLTAECRLPSPGNITDCFGGRGQTDSDNNGLWTSLVVGAEYFRYAVTKSDEAAKSAAHFLAGMQRLHDVTNTPGLYARSLCKPPPPRTHRCHRASPLPLPGASPSKMTDITCCILVGAPEDNGTPRHICASTRSTQYTGPCGFEPSKCPKACSHCGVQFRNSSNPKFEGWVWKSDTSSDESAGHFFAFALAAQLAPTASEREAAAKTLADMVDYMVAHGMNLVGKRCCFLDSCVFQCCISHVPAVNPGLIEKVSSPFRLDWSPDDLGALVAGLRQWVAAL